MSFYKYSWFWGLYRTGCTWKRTPREAAKRRSGYEDLQIKEHKIDLIWGDWQKAHIRSNNCCGKNQYSNKFPSHGFCNREQHTRNLFEIRKFSKLSDTPFQNRMSVEEAEAFLNNNIK